MGGFMHRRWPAQRAQRLDADRLRRLHRHHGQPGGVLLLNAFDLPQFGPRVSGVGRAVHSKSALQPIPVLDVLVQFDVQPAGLKPGQTVRVEFVP